MFSINQKRTSLIPTLSRTSPVTIIIILVLNLFVNPSVNSLFLLCMHIGNLVLNFGIKNFIFKPIYKSKKTNSLPFIGIGGRPKGATNCGFEVGSKEKATSFGMPSGHSQSIWAVITYLLFKITNKYMNNEVHNEVLSVFWLIGAYLIGLTVGVYVSYSRVYIEGCHTLPQVIIGGLIGFIYGMIVFFIEKYAL